MKARLVSESIKFQRGGSDQTIKDKILGRLPKGSLYLSSGKFPYLYMLIGNAAPDAEEAEFLNIGHFQGGGGKKTRFNFVSTRNLDSYSWRLSFLKKNFSPRQWSLIQDAVWTDPDGVNSWDRIEENSGIKPILPMNESIRFERGQSDADIKRGLRQDGPFQPGEIMIQDQSYWNRDHRLFVYVGYDPKGYLAPHSAYSFGNIGRDHADFIHNTDNKTGMSGLQDNDLLRRATAEEARKIRKALTSGKYDRYIEEAKKKTGLTPFV